MQGTLLTTTKYETSSINLLGDTPASSASQLLTICLKECEAVCRVRIARLSSSYLAVKPLQFYFKRAGIFTYLFIYVIAKLFFKFGTNLKY